MYAEFYNLNALPFQLTPDFRFFFESSVHAKAMAHLTYGLNQGEGFIVVTGDVGAGKTTLVEYLCSGLDPNLYTIVKISTTQISADDTLRMVAARFGIKSEGVDKANLLQRLEAALTANFKEGRRALLIVDEAQNLSVTTLEELRMLSNFIIDNKALMQSFLLGQPQFRPILALPELEQLRQRVLASYHLGPLGAEETRAYIEHRLRHAGWKEDPQFTDEAFERIHEASGGLPRKINTLCSRLMLLGFLEECHTITAPMVDEVVVELRAELGGEPAVAEPSAPPQPAPKPAWETVDKSPGAAVPDDIDARLEQIEARLHKHDDAIKRTLAIVASVVEGKVA